MNTAASKRLAVLRATALTVALMGVHGTAAAETYMWTKVVSDGSTQTFSDDSFEPTAGKNQRGVLSTGGSTVTLNNDTVTTDADGLWGAHGVEAYGNGSTLNVVGGTITTTGQYSNGIQAEQGGVVNGQNAVISVDGGSSYTFGVEAGDGGAVNLNGGSIDVNGVVAAGARAYTGSGKTEQGKVTLDGTAINVSGTSSIGLMAGDTDNGPGTGTAGEITYTNGTVTATGSGALGARVMYGSTLNLANATLDSQNGQGLVVDGSGSTAVVSNSAIKVHEGGTGNNDQRWAS